MEIFDTQTTIEKRSLKKIRKPFLNRNTPQSETELAVIEKPAPTFTQDEVNVLHKSFGFVEIKGKLYSSFGYLNPFLQQVNFRIQDTSPQKLVTLNFSFIDGVFKSTEESAQRLESYGCPDLNLWAERLRNYDQKHAAMMSDYYKLVASDDSEKIAKLRRAKTKAALACREIETTYSVFAKILSFSGEKSTDFLSVSYTQDFLQELGHASSEEFIEWTKINGPQVFTHNCSTYLEFSKGLFECPPFPENETVIIGHQYDPLVFDKSGQNKNLKAQYVSVFDPTPTGFFVSFYFILNYDDNNSDQVKNRRKESISDDIEEEVKEIEEIEPPIMNKNTANLCRSFKGTLMSLENLD